MSLLAFENLEKAYGVQDVFTGISAALPHGARVALVGPNGVGKTTLLRLLAGLETPDQGRVHRSRHVRLGYLPQEASYSRSRRGDLELSLWDTCLVAFRDLIKREAQLAELEAAMAQPDKAENILEKYGALQEAFERDGGYTYTTKIKQVFNGLGFMPEDYHRPLAQFSGGEQTRALLARVLLETPDLLVLDEPTNHLDIEAIEWLEGWLRDWDGAVLIVSHDRYFLDRTVNRVWDLSSRVLDVYRGNYSAYTVQRAERRSNYQMQFKAQQNHIRKEEEFIQRNIAGQKTRQAQGRRRRLERLLRDESLDQLRNEKQVRINFGDAVRSGDHVLKTQDLVVGHHDVDEVLFRVPDLILMRGEFVALLGPNGSGKSTFLKTVLEQISPRSGIVQLGANLSIGYFAQAHEGLDPEQTVLEQVLQAGPHLTISEARNLLALFLFRGDDIDKLVETLSGGERGRLALARLVLEGANLLMLDEPTNHLDIAAQEALQSALEQFPGTILLVSHDRYLVDALATQIWMVVPEDKKMIVHRGSYAELQDYRRLEIEKQKKSKKPARRKKPEDTGKKIRHDLESLESDIAALENELQDLTRELDVQGLPMDRLRELGEQYADVEVRLSERMSAWELLAKQLDQP
jgi:ATP-binding cassette, subfamily F, member 3